VESVSSVLIRGSDNFLSGSGATPTTKYAWSRSWSDSDCKISSDSDYGNKANAHATGFRIGLKPVRNDRIRGVGGGGDPDYEICVVS